jgi:hypothetical protein
MPVSKVINQQSFHDGKVVLYQLEDRPKRLWLCRMKVPNGVGYIYRGTVRRDNQDENPATIRMRMRRCWGDEGRA